MQPVPKQHQELLRGDRDAGSAYFRSHYRYRPYEDLADELSATVHDQLHDREGGLVYTRNFWVRSNNAAQDLVVVQDIAEQDSYRISELPMPRPVIVDVGAHIGCFSQAIHSRNPLARIFAVECCPENLPALRKNVGGFATVIQGAMTYEKDIALLNAVFPDCVTTGGSCVVSRDQLQQAAGNAGIGTDPKDAATAQYWTDSRPLMAVTLEQIIEQHKLERIDVLKLDCEGSEFSILEDSTSLERVVRIVGEYHGKNRFHQLVQRKFSNWKLRILKDGELGTFWLENPRQATNDSQPIRHSPPRHSPPRHSPLSTSHPPPAMDLSLYASTYGNALPARTPRTTSEDFVLEVRSDASQRSSARRMASIASRRSNQLSRAVGIGSAHTGGPSRMDQAGSGETADHDPRQTDRIPPGTLARHWHDLLVSVTSHGCFHPGSVAGRHLGVTPPRHRCGRKHPCRLPLFGSGQDDCFFFCVDHWQTHRERALELLSYLDLEPTQEMYDYLACWPSPNAAEAHEHLIVDKSPELAEARRLSLQDGQVHPVMEPWAERLRAAGLQRFCESLGYSDLAWFE